MESVFFINTFVSFQHLAEILESHFFTENAILFDDFTEIWLTIFHEKVVSLVIFDSLHQFNYIRTARKLFVKLK